MTLDDGTELECAVVTVFQSQEQQYIALLPLDEGGENHDGEVFLYRFSEEDGEPALGYIDDDDEYDAAAEAFDAWLEDGEYDEFVPE